MELKELTCRRCGAQMPYTPGSTRIKCPYCDTEYILNTAGAGQAPEKRGVVYQGGFVFYADIPDGWSSSVFLDYDGVSSAAAFCLGTNLSCGNTSIRIMPFGYFKDSAPEGVDGMTLINRRKFRTLEEHAAHQIKKHCKGAQITELRPVKHELGRVAQMFGGMSANVLGETQTDAGKFYFKLDIKGHGFDGFFATVRAFRPGKLEKLNEGAQSAQRRAAARSEKPNGFKLGGMSFDQFMRGGIVGMMMRGEYEGGSGEGFKMPDISGVGDRLKNLGKPYSWGKYYDVLLLSPCQPEGGSAGYESVFDGICQSFSYAPLYFQLQQQALSAAQQVTVQGNMQRQQYQMQASQRLSNTLHKQNDIIMQGYENRRAAQDRMQTKYSEAVRGVNSYTDLSGHKVEASVRYDHVYQNGSYYAGSDAPVDLGADWTELKKND